MFDKITKHQLVSIDRSGSIWKYVVEYYIIICYGVMLNERCNMKCLTNKQQML